MRAAFVIAGLAGCLWAAASAAALALLPAARGPQRAPQAPPKPPVPARPGAPGGRWSLGGAAARQVALLCFAHGVIGLGFFVFSSWLPRWVHGWGSKAVVKDSLTRLPLRVDGCSPAAGHMPP